MKPGITKRRDQRKIQRLIHSIPRKPLKKSEKPFTKSEKVILSLERYSRIKIFVKAMAEDKAKAEGRTLSNYIEQLIIRDNEESR